MGSGEVMVPGGNVEIKPGQRIEAGGIEFALHYRDTPRSRADSPRWVRCRLRKRRCDW